jgi:hypothetical protein
MRILDAIIFFPPIALADRLSRGKGQASADMWATILLGSWIVILLVDIVVLLLIFSEVI